MSDRQKNSNSNYFKVLKKIEKLNKKIIDLYNTHRMK